MVNEFRDRMEKSLEEAKSALAKAKDYMARYYNQRRIPAPEYHVGNRVFLGASNIRTTPPSRKLGHRYLSPYVIQSQVGKHSYKLQLPLSMSRLHPVFNVVKLIPAPEDPIPGRRAEPPPPPELVDGEEHYVVEKVLDSRLMRGRLHFLVKWEGDGYGENTWVAEEDMAAPAKVREFYQLHPGAPRRIWSMAFELLMSRASRTQHPRRGGDVRGPPISNSKPSPRRSTCPEVHRTKTRTQVRSSDVTPQSRHKIHRTKHRPGYRSTGYRSWGQRTFRRNRGVRYVEEAGNGQRVYKLHS